MLHVTDLCSPRNVLKMTVWCSPVINLRLNASISKWYCALACDFIRGAKGIICSVVRKETRRNSMRAHLAEEGMEMFRCSSGEKKINYSSTWEVSSSATDGSTLQWDGFWWVPAQLNTSSAKSCSKSEKWQITSQVSELFELSIWTGRM